MIKTAIELHKAGQLQQAKARYRDILNTEPDHPDALHLYGLACHQLGDHETAVRYIRKAVERVPTQAVLRNNLGDALHRAGQIEEAIQQLHTALELRPGYAGAHQNLGSIYLQAGSHDQALRHCKLATELNASGAEGWFNLGLCYLEHVLLESSADAFRRALALRPDYLSAVTSLMYVLNLVPGSSPQAVAEETRRVAAAAFNETPVKGASVNKDSIDEDSVDEDSVDGDSVNKNSIHSGQLTSAKRKTNQPVRIGYVSGDFCRHAVNYFFEPVIEHHDRSTFEVFCYSDVAQPDDATRRLQQSAAHWRDMTGCSDAALLSQVQADRIDILIDLAGYTRHNRLPVFARQAAPVQVSWLGFPNTSGLQAMNYRIVDNTTAAADKADFGTETLLRMPDIFACFRPPEHAPEVADSPCINNGYVTLGSLHKLEKLNPQVIELWAQILLENPETRLMLARDQLDDWHQARLQKLFSQHGIESDRLQMIQLDAQSPSFFELFASMDILLDVFPWSGHTLACCALWMGVPVISLSGGSHASRMVASVLHSIGLDEWVAADHHAYIDAVKKLCGDQAQLIKYRRELRARFMRSPLRDEVTFTRQLESEYRRILNL